LNRLSAEVHKVQPDFIAFRASLGPLLEKNERKLLESDSKPDQATSIEGVTALMESPRPNALGRYMVVRAMHQLVNHADRLVRELDTEVARTKEFSKARPPVSL
jgi:hypothetical protein